MARKGRSEFVTNDHQMYRRVRRRTNRTQMGRIAAQRPTAQVMNASRVVSDVLSSGEWSGDTRPISDRVQSRYRTSRGAHEQEKKVYIAPPFSHKGVRASILAGFLALMLVVLTVVTVVSTVRLSEQRKTNDDLRAQLIQTNQKCGELQAKISASSDEIQLAYTAKDYGLVSAGSLPVILLEAPAEAGVSPEQGMGAMPSEALAVIFAQ